MTIFFDACRYCFKKGSDRANCKIRSGLRGKIARTTSDSDWPDEIDCVTIHARCAERDRGVEIGRRVEALVHPIINVDDYSWDTDRESLVPVTGVITGLPRRINGKILVYFDCTTQTALRAGRIRRDRLRLLPGSESVCNECMNPTRACDCISKNEEDYVLTDRQEIARSEGYWLSCPLEFDPDTGYRFRD